MKTYRKPTLKFIDVEITEILAGSDPTGLNGYEEGDGCAKRQNRIIIDDDEDENF